MHWLFLVYLLYVWKTRGTSVVQVKSCTNCKFFLPPTLDTHNRQTVALGKCMLYPYPDKTVPTLVIGMSDIDVGSHFRYAVAARTSETMCGHSARQFVSKIRPPHPPTH